MSKDSQDKREDELIELGRLSAEVAHEIRNYLTPILANAEHLSLHSDREVSEAANRILANATLCRSFVQHILGGLAQQSARTTTFDLAHTVKDYLASRQGSSSIHVAMQDDTAFEVEGEPSMIVSLFENLIRNAEEAANNGPAQITIQFKTDDEKQIVATIEDDGPGIPAKIHDTLFEEFKTAEKETGTGLGLSLCRKVALEHNGSLGLLRSNDKGTTFELRLPFSKKSITDPQVNETTLPPLKILCIDDDQSTLDTYGMILGLDNHKVTPAANGKSGFRALEEDTYDVILCDLRLPDINGMEFHRRLVASNPGAANSVVFVTGDLMNEESQAYLTSAQRPYLIKPFEIEELRVAIRVALNAQGK
ncbi:MAG: CheY-like chemotaxis protein [Planctomycetota bacterium]|jgi:CheY-like chemotaxis protein